MKQYTESNQFCKQRTRSAGGSHSYFEKIISLENIFGAWREFQRGKRGKTDVMHFSLYAETSLIALQRELISGTYCHSQYTHFRVADPKPRDIHKAQVRDRVLHHAIHRVLAPIFGKRFIGDSYSSRVGKGTHKAIARFEKNAWQLSRNRTRTVWVLQFDIRQFFASVDHERLLKLVTTVSKEPRLVELLARIVRSFNTMPGRGIPLGNLTSQLFANIYLDTLDQYAKRVLQIPVFIRYADDVLIAHTKREKLEEWLELLTIFIETELELRVHPTKTTLRAWHQGVDFLGYVSFPRHRIIRVKTKKRLLRRLCKRNAPSYFGITQHAKSWQVEEKMRGILKK
jgi:retron-type reverse transcriptase